LKRIKIALDANIPERAVRMLNSGFKSNGFEFHWEPSFAPASATDEFWATAFKRFGGTVIITGDKNIARRPHQIHAFCACDLICFFCDRHWSQQDLAYQCAHLIRWWPTVQDTLQTAKPKDCWWLPMGLRGELKKVQVPDIKDPVRKSKAI
jgi:hypothetical protein